MLSTKIDSEKKCPSSMSRGGRRLMVDKERFAENAHHATMKCMKIQTFQLVGLNTSRRPLLIVPIMKCVT